MDEQSRWQKAKQIRLCYRCLGRNHKGGRCTQNSRWGIDGCQKTYKRLLKDPQLAESYSEVISKYSEKGYISKVTPSKTE